jgi:hypothetical protein
MWGLRIQYIANRKKKEMGHRHIGKSLATFIVPD